MIPVDGYFLPAGDRQGLRVDRLSQLFSRTDTSYKFLWTLAILDEFARGVPPMEDPFHRIRFGTLTKRMLKRAHVFTRRYKLHMGHRDMLETHLVRIIEDNGGTIEDRRGHFKADRHERFWRTVQLNEAGAAFKNMLRLVPRRLLVPFLDVSLTAKRLKDKHAILDSHYGKGWQPDEQPPLYYYDYSRNEIQVPEQWCGYLAQHNTILTNWVCWNLLRYLAKRNPNVPGLEQKIMPETRSRPTQAIKLWDMVFAAKGGQLLCPYSSMPITAKQHELDHFIPHAFVSHNQPWNLVPASKTANNAKLDRLPLLDRYLDNFLDQQEMAVGMLARRPEKLDELVHSYQLDVLEGEKLDSVATPEGKPAFRDKLTRLIRRNHEAAASQGFTLWSPPN